MTSKTISSCAKFKFAGDEWCVQTCNGGDSIECGRLVNGNDVGDFDEDMFESRVGLAMFEIASFHA